MRRNLILHHLPAERRRRQARYHRRPRMRIMSEPEDPPATSSAPEPVRPEPGGPYFGRLLIVLFLAVAFCAFMTWLLSTLMVE